MDFYYFFYFREIEKNAFAKLKNLEKLDLENCKLKTLNALFLENNKQIVELNIAGNYFSSNLFEFVANLEFKFSIVCINLPIN